MGDNLELIPQTETIFCYWDPRVFCGEDIKSLLTYDFSDLQIMSVAGLPIINAESACF